MFYIPTLTIAGSDCSGGAGMEADIKTMSALGCYATAVITSVTVQNTCGVTDIQDIRPDIVGGQIRAVMGDIHPQSVKVGMVNNCAIIHAIADALEEYRPNLLVVDPVMVSSSGSQLMKDNALGTFCQRLIPLATLLTPNLPEAEILADMCITRPEDIDQAAEKMMRYGCKAVLIKGGHSNGPKKTDRLYIAKEKPVLFQSQSVPTKNTHGTGCTLSSAITAYLARGMNLLQAVEAAKQYVTRALTAGSNVKIGQGIGPVNHFFNPEKLIKL
ncbi:MAG: bifunctional hydroxymethylpyrimidine kinase/phosphomethylpyrimidine kinase [Prevotella sp.]|nr:bifunctional hydroxymethylpyrimidine kinase/phosphomethylpyrimidine kinase [Prevotella sp.]